ncbi:hypothetical protein BRC83_10655 [Halobacteriales archaeon QS_1_68_17]|nr:MAG: hypothetical protein BRC83_10655 [Halobacteriales archaeon QS_1_68_17]
MMGVYAFAGGKGGVGKTTTAVNVGVTLSADSHDVVVVDADLEMTEFRSDAVYRYGTGTPLRPRG